MQNRLTPAQLTRLVGEVARLSQRQQEELDRGQVQEILRELNLPPDLLDEAMIQLQRKDALAVQQRRQRWLIGGAIASVIVAIVGITLFMQQKDQAYAHVSVQQDRITSVQNPDGNLTTVLRQSAPELAYNVTLKDAPVGKTLPLACDWVAPGGQIVKQNRYETRQVTTSVWETHCRYQLPTSAPTGTWDVRLKLGDRQLSDAKFDVK